MKKIVALSKASVLISIAEATILFKSVFLAEVMAGFRREEADRLELGRRERNILEGAPLRIGGRLVRRPDLNQLRAAAREVGSPGLLRGVARDTRGRLMRFDVAHARANYARERGHMVGNPHAPIFKSNMPVDIQNAYVRGGDRPFRRVEEES